MPIFEYKCAVCDSRFESLRSVSAKDPVICPACGSDRTIKLFSTFAGKTASGGVQSAGQGCRGGSGFS